MQASLHHGFWLVAFTKKEMEIPAGTSISLISRIYSACLNNYVIFLFAVFLRSFCLLLWHRRLLLQVCRFDRVFHICVIRLAVFVIQRLQEDRSENRAYDNKQDDRREILR